MKEPRKGTLKKKKLTAFELGLRILPLLPVLGILYQLRALYGVNNMAGLLFFSWTQVLNDTAGILPFLIPVIVSIGGGIAVYHWLESCWNPKKNEKWYGKVFLFLRLLLAWALAGILISSVLGAIPLTVFGEWSWGGFYSVVRLGVIYYAYGSFAWLCQKGIQVFWISEFLKIEMDSVYDLIRSIFPWLVWGCLSISGIAIFLPIYHKSTATNLCLWREGDNIIPISYMNDRFAFSSGAVHSDSGSIFIGTGTIVFSRMENDRIFQCIGKD